LLLGSAPGPMGATNILVVVACGIFLIVKKAINWIEPVSFILPYSVLCLLFPRIGGSPLEALCYELFSGALIFGAFFMLTEPVTSPKRDFGKLMAGVSSAVVVFLFRYFGKFEMGFASALILMNVFSPIFDSVCENVLHVLRHTDNISASIKAEIAAKKAAKTVSEPVVRPVKKTEEAEIAEVSEEIAEIEAIEVSEEVLEAEIETTEETEKEEALAQ
ncbi:MAG: RnfABCDGE type electron transport complex subunit D, partial [Oscillospiraceae bacterium]|nr:RnfABCDGE type electron transport complex subunit D [Oscillospiraceae bacterium]